MITRQLSVAHKLHVFLREGRHVTPTTYPKQGAIQFGLITGNSAKHQGWNGTQSGFVEKTWKSQ